MRRKAAVGTGLVIPGAGTRDFGKMGPHMRALNDRQRSFVVAMMDQGMVNHTRAAMAAGYQGDNVALRATAYRLAHDERIQAAIQEEARKRITSGSLMAVSALLAIAENPVHKDQLKAVDMILNRSGLHALSEHKVTVERAGGTAAEVIAEIKALATTLGMDPTRLLGRTAVQKLETENIEDAEYEEVRDGTDAEIEAHNEAVRLGRDGLEDLL